MLKLGKSRMDKGMILVILAVFVLGGIALANQTDEELKKKYAPILGNYEFDATEYGLGVLTIEVYVDYGSLWALPETSDSAGQMIAVEGEEMSFKIEDPDEGTYEIKFLKDDEGVYDKCHVVNELMGMNLVGKKLK